MSWTEDHNERVDRRLQQIHQLIVECPYCALLVAEATKLVGMRPEPLIVHRSQISKELLREIDRRYLDEQIEALKP